MAVGFAREMAEATAKPSGAEAGALDKKIRATEQRIKGASRAIAKAPADVPLDPLYVQLREDKRRSRTCAVGAGALA